MRFGVEMGRHLGRKRAILGTEIGVELGAQIGAATSVFGRRKKIRVTPFSLQKLPNHVPYQTNLFQVTK